MANARFAMGTGGPEAWDHVRAAFERALELQPDLSDALLARSTYRRFVQADFAAAAADLRAAEASGPLSGELEMVAAALARDQFDWPGALAHTREAVARDPYNGDILNAGAITLMQMGYFVEADALLVRAVSIQGSASEVPGSNRNLLRLVWRGPAAAIRMDERETHTTAETRSDEDRFGDFYYSGKKAEARGVAEMIERRADEAGKSGLGLTELLVIGWTERAAALAEKRRPIILGRYEKGLRDGLTMGGLVRCELALGHLPEARSRLAEWRQLTDAKLNAFWRAIERGQMVPLCALAGEKDEAIKILQEEWQAGFRDPTPLFDMAFDSLRGDPRFEEYQRQALDFMATQPDPADDPQATMAEVRQFLAQRSR